MRSTSWLQVLFQIVAQDVAEKIFECLRLEIWISINSNKDTFGNESIYNLVSGAAQRYRINDTNMGVAEYVALTPMITTPGTTTRQVCTNNRIILEDPDACT